MPTTVTFIGSAPVLPEVGRDSACFALNGRHLVDCGWNAALEMRRYGLDSLALETLLITHCHHDHVMGLPMLLFYRGMKGQREGKPPPLRIYGPAGELEEAVENARRFLRAERFPEVWPAVELSPLAPGDRVEADGIRFRVAEAIHPVPALSYRVEDTETGAVVAFTGDTGYKPELAELFTGADLLIHEASLPPGRTDRGGYGHSTPEEAAQIARDAGVKRLALIHYGDALGPVLLEAAWQIFPDTFLAKEGVRLDLP